MEINKNIIVTQDIVETIKSAIQDYFAKKTYILVDENTYKHCFPLIEKAFIFPPQIITIKSGDENKNLETSQIIWNYLSNNEGDRSSLLINLGGGVITDIGGFVASSFKRGIDFINIPTTLLAQVDASIGGKVGINSNGLKNEIGFFSHAKKVLIYPEFLKTLDKNELISGFGEVVKHALIDSPESWNKLQSFNTENIDYLKLQNLIEKSAQVKQKIISQDPTEKGIRQSLNFGHTFGHAIETFLGRKNIKILHGEAVAIGLICELFISNKILDLDLSKMFKIVEYIAINFKSFKIEMDSYEEIYELMKHDKKNINNEIRFALISDIGEVKVNQTCEKSNIFQALNFYYQLKK